MRERERRALLVIEKNLLAEAPELAALFDPPPEPDRIKRRRRAMRWLTATVLLLAVVVGDTTLLFGGLALLSMFAVRWTVVEVCVDEPDRRGP